MSDEWRNWIWKSAPCSTLSCIEIGSRPGADAVMIRTSRWRRILVTASRDEFAAFVAGVKAGEFDDLG